jgi:hypothetical protein
MQRPSGSFNIAVSTLVQLIPCTNVVQLFLIRMATLMLRRPLHHFPPDPNLTTGMVWVFNGADR